MKQFSDEFRVFDTKISEREYLELGRFEIYDHLPS
jgi:hypothetical protein